MSNEIIRPKPMVLIILDGWGIAQESLSNAIGQAKTPNFDKFCQNYFCCTLQASGEAVGLPLGEMGNSEVGHLNIGAGRIVYQDLPRINHSITTKEIFQNPIFVNACEHVLKNQSKLHLIGLLSNGGVHGAVDHLYALLELAKEKQVKEVFIHVILDGRDMVYNSGANLVLELNNYLQKIGLGEIATISGRFWAMDRDNHWDRTARAYEAMISGQSQNCDIDAVKAIEKSYANKVYDEEFKPTVIQNGAGQPLTKISDSDAVIFFNFRADRARQLTKAFVLPNFDKFDRGPYLKDLHFVTMTEYEKNLPVEVAYPPEAIKTSLAKVLSDNNFRQLHVAETEKYAHVTYFFNGGVEEPFNGEDRALTPSPSVENYATTPEMSAYEIKDRVIKEINEGKYDFMVINFANLDMVSHTGNLPATVKAAEVVDRCLGEIVELILSVGGVAVITADHGNAEELINLQTGEINKEHSTCPVPFIVVGRDYQVLEQAAAKVNLALLIPTGLLSDVTPTILKIMKLEKPEEMTGRALI